jgi:hypothetical protein
MVLLRGNRDEANWRAMARPTIEVDGNDKMAESAAV